MGFFSIFLLFSFQARTTEAPGNAGTEKQSPRRPEGLASDPLRLR